MKLLKYIGISYRYKSHFIAKGEMRFITRQQFKKSFNALNCSIEGKSLVILWKQGYDSRLLFFFRNI